MDDIRVLGEDHIPTLKLSHAATVETAADRAIVHVEVRVNIREQKSSLPKTTVVDNVRSVLAACPLLDGGGESIQQCFDHKDRSSTLWNFTLVAEPANDPQVRAELQEVISRLAGVEHCHITGPEWELSAPTRAEAETRAHTRAVRTAYDRAQHIAAELGYEVAGLAQLDAAHHQRDPHVLSESMEFAARGVKSRVPARVLEVGVRPPMLPVTGAIDAVFTLRRRAEPIR
ncbi:SIMPL domain-containing protein [Corynebacterium sp.]|uniref:SIMPL domain-containing protein n=1 Tax=Corynebacterium sp. TaxID=1720 RepID=UPI0026DA6F95|nr:SIMPL domain-containing protein [Corynebacterium sp.]MDO5075694.1 SIMPL domain-containing protein [Corynebacterium sp.]